MRSIVIATALVFVAGWVIVENIGVARFLPPPASDLTQITSANAWTTAGGNPSRDGAALTSKPIGNVIVWVADLGAPPAGAPIIASGAVFIGSADGIMHALSISDGTEIWASNVNAPVSSTASFVDDFVYVGLLDGRVIALNASTGNVDWEFTTDQPVRSSPAVVDGVLYFGSSDRRLYALDAMTGEIRWSFATGGRITSDPSVNKHQVIVTSQDNFVHFIDKKTAKRNFDYEVSLTNGSAAVAGDSVFVGDVNGVIRRIHWENRVMPFEKAIRSIKQWMFRWGMTDKLPPQKGVVWVTQDSGESFQGTPAVDDSAVYVGTSKGQLLALQRETGMQLWRTVVGTSTLTSPTIVGNQVLVGDASGYLSAINRSTGEIIWQLSVGLTVSEGIAVGDTRIVVVNDSGNISALR